MRRRIAGACTLAASLALVVTAQASAATWTDESDMISSGTFRSTFVADPGPTLWDRADLIRDHGAFYRTRGRGNILVWAPAVVIKPDTTALWAGCSTLPLQQGYDCPNGVPLHMREIGLALSDTTIHAFAAGGSFIARACGNFSAVEVAGPTPTISGKKFEDVNANGTRDSGEPGLSGWTIQLYQHGTLLTSTTTGVNGDYKIALDANTMPIDAQEFELREVQQSGWAASRTPAAVTVPFGSGTADFGGNDFGNYRPATINGLKYEDMEADGDRDADDPGLPDWTIELRSGPSSPRSTVTGASGAYAFGGLRPGTYTVGEQLKAGWRYSVPTDGTRTITVRSGEDAAAEFGNYRPATIDGTKFDDHDVNRSRGAGDQGLQGWTIDLKGGRSADATDVTDPDGRYDFGGLIPGTYVVGETQKAGWRQSAPASGTHTVTVRSGDAKHADFGNVCLGTARVSITNESSGAALAGVEVRVEEISVTGVLANQPALPRTTSGTPTFADLLPGTYRVIAFLPQRAYTTDPDLTVVDGRLAVVKRITVGECETTVVPIKLFPTSIGKVTGGMKMQVPGGFATAGFVFMTRSGVPEGSLQYVDHVTGMNLHSDRIEQIHVRGTDAWIGGLVDIGGVTHRFQLHLVDNGEPGTQDRFELIVENGYRAGYGETIEGGNDQIHRPERT